MNVPPASPLPGAVERALDADIHAAVAYASNALNTSAKVSLPSIMTEATLFGVYSILIGYIAWLTLTRGLMPRSRLIMVLLCAIMYATALVHYATRASDATTAADSTAVLTAKAWIRMYCLESDVLNITVAVPIDCPPGLDALPAADSPASSVSMYLNVPFLINIILSDVIVSWRACTICAYNRIVVSISTGLVLATIVTSAYSASLAPRNGVSASLFGVSSVVLSTSQQFPDICGVTAFVLSWLTNVWAVGLISWKTWKHRRMVRRNLQGSFRTQAGTLMLMFVESGLAYCALWTVLAVELFLEMKYSIVGPDISAGLFESGMLLFREYGLIDLIGIYPAIIVVLADLVKAHSERTICEGDVRTPQIVPVSARPHQQFASLLETLSAAEQRGIEPDAEAMLGVQQGHSDIFECSDRSSSRATVNKSVADRSAVV